MKRLSEADLRLLQIFAVVADFKGFAAAQAELNLSASSISNYMSALEQRLGVRLCSRGRAGFELTDKGAIIYREAKRLFAAVEDFTASAGAVRGRLTGNLKVGLVDCTLSDPNSPVRRAIERFNRRDNEVRIQLTIEAPQDLQRGVLDGRLNLAVGSFPARVAALAAQPLYNETQEFYCGRGHPLFDRQAVSLDDIRAQRVVARGYWRRADLNRIGVDREAATVDHMEAQAVLILSGAYVGYLPRHYAASWVSSGDLSSLLPGELAYEAPFSLITRRAGSKVTVVRCFIEDLMRSLGDPRPAIAVSRPRSGHLPAGASKALKRKA